VLSGVLRAGHESTAGLSPLSTPNSILICNDRHFIIVPLLREPLSERNGVHLSGKGMGIS